MAHPAGPDQQRPIEHPVELRPNSILRFTVFNFPVPSLRPAVFVVVVVPHSAVRTFQFLIVFSCTQALYRRFSTFNCQFPISNCFLLYERSLGRG